MKVRSFLIFLVLVLFALDLIAQTSFETVSTNSPADTLNTDSLKVVEDAPLDIGQNRGLFIITPDRNMQLRILGSIRFLAVYDNIDLFSKDSFVTTEIPTGDENKNFPNYYNDLRQTRLGFEITRKTELGNLFIRLETDFSGVGGFRIRHAYGQFRGFLVGQTWSLFTQISVLPTTVDFSGPTAAITTRTPQIRYTFNVRKKAKFAVSLEYQVQDIRLPDSTNASTFPLLPNLTGRFTRNFEWGLLQVSGVMPVLSARGANDELFVKFGWGLSIGALIKPWVNGSWHFQLAAGRSISRFLGDVNADVNLVIGPNGEIVLPFELGYYATYQHSWSKKFLSNLVYGAVQIEELSFASEDTYSWGSTWHLNTFYKPVDGAKVGIEGIWGQRTDKSNANGNAFRFNMIFYYDF
jgi:hypothetical protein